MRLVQTCWIDNSDDGVYTRYRGYLYGGSRKQFTVIGLRLPRSGRFTVTIRTSARGAYKVVRPNLYPRVYRADADDTRLSTSFSYACFLSRFVGQRINVSIRKLF